jgi:hypothetical protein
MKRNRSSARLLRATGGGLIALLLGLSLTSCASVSDVPEFIPCQHPQVDLSTNGGYAQGLLDYSTALDTCNAINGLIPTTPSKE